MIDGLHLDLHRKYLLFYFLAGFGHWVPYLQPISPELNYLLNLSSTKQGNGTDLLYRLQCCTNNLIKTHFVFIVWTKRHKRFASVWQVENCYASRSVSLKTGASAVALPGVGAAGLGGLKTFQGLEGQWRGSPGTTSAAGEADGLAAPVSSSEDSSLGVEPGGSTFLSGVQPGGRRLLKGWEGVSSWINWSWGEKWSTDNLLLWSKIRFYTEAFLTLEWDHFTINSLFTFSR